MNFKQVMCKDFLAKNCEEMIAQDSGPIRIVVRYINYSLQKITSQRGRATLR